MYRLCICIHKKSSGVHLFTCFLKQSGEVIFFKLACSGYPILYLRGETESVILLYTVGLNSTLHRICYFREALRKIAKFYLSLILAKFAKSVCSRSRGSCFLTITQTHTHIYIIYTHIFTYIYTGFLCLFVKCHKLYQRHLI